jgi:hypothetical protein
MNVKVTPELISRTLEAQGVAADPARVEAHAAFTTTVLNASAAAFGQLPFEQEPAGYTVEMRRTAV